MKLIHSLTFVFLFCAGAAIAGEHAHEAPHKGALIELGDHFAHAEMVLDKATGKSTIYLLDGHAEKSVRVAQPTIEVKVAGIDAPIVFKAVESVLSGEKVGDTSEFAVQSDALKGKEKFEASIVALKIKGKDLKDIKFKYPEGNE